MEMVDSPLNGRFTLVRGANLPSSACLYEIDPDIASSFSEAGFVVQFEDWRLVPEKFRNCDQATQTDNP